MAIKIRKLEETIRKLEAELSSKKAELAELMKVKPKEKKPKEKKPKKQKENRLNLTTVEQAKRLYPEVFGGPDSLSNYRNMFLGIDDGGYIDEQYMENYDIEDPDPDNLPYEKQIEILTDLLTDTEIQGMVWRMEVDNWEREDAPEMSPKVFKYFIECVFGDEADKIYKLIK